MKKLVLKSIIIMMVALVSQAAGAQTLDIEEMLKEKPAAAAVEACRQYLLANPDTVIEVYFKEPIPVEAKTGGLIDGQAVNVGDTILWVGYHIYGKEDPVLKVKATRKKAYRKTVVVKSEPIQVVNFQEADALDRKAVETRFEYDITDGHRRDVRGYQLSTAINSPDGKAIKKAADKNGWAVQVEGSYQLADNCSAFTGRAGLAYTGRWWQVDLMGGATRTFYSDNATEENAGTKYWAYGTEAGIWFQPFKLDRYDCNRVYVGGGAGWEWYRTDSQEKDGLFLQSEGNYIYPHAGVQFEHRFFATGNSLYCKAQWRQKKLIIQNEDREVNNAFEFSLGFRFGFMRNRISH